MSKWLKEIGDATFPNATDNAVQVPLGLDVEKELSRIKGKDNQPKTSLLADLINSERLPKQNASVHIPLAGVFSQDGQSLHPAGEAFKRLRTRISNLQAQRHVRTVIISSAVQGEGKTHTALNLALCCAQLQHFPVLLIDADLRNQGLSRLLGMPNSSGLSEVLAGRTTQENAVAASSIHNLFVIPAGADSLAPPELFMSSRWQEFLDWGKRTFKLVLVDSPPILDLTDFDLISAPCDATLVVVRAEGTSREQLRRCSAQLESRMLVGVVFNASLSYKCAYY